DEEDAVEVPECLLALALEQLVAGLGEHRRPAGGLGVLAALLADGDAVEDLALDTELAAGDLLVVVIHAAVDRLTGGALVPVGALRKERRLPTLRRDLVAQLDVRERDRDDGESEARLFEYPW